MEIKTEERTFKLMTNEGSQHFKTLKEAKAYANSKNHKWFAIRLYYFDGKDVIAGPYLEISENAKLEK